MILSEVEAEYYSAAENFPPFNSVHEGYAVLLEEVDELWENVKLNKHKHPERNELIREEAIQVAAMAVRLITDLETAIQ